MAQTILATVLIAAVLVIGYELYAATNREWGENTISLFEYILKMRGLK